jgi:hypothetical protein
MKRIILISILFAALFTIKGQFSYFNTIYNNDTWSVGWSILENEPGYVVCGVSGEESQGYVFKRIVLTGIDAAGNQLWWKTYGEDFHNYYAGNTRGCSKTSDGGYVLGGTIEDSIRVVGLLFKFDEAGDSSWVKIYGDTVTPGYTGTSFNTCRQLPDKGYLLLGDRYISGDDADVLLIRTDSLGNTLWEKTYGALHKVESGFFIVPLSTGEILIGLMKQNINVNYSADPGLLKVDSIGNLIWLKYYGSTMNDWGCSVIESSDGNYLVGSAYCTAEPAPGWPLLQPWIFKTDTSGNIIWQRKYEGPRFTGNSITIDELDDGSIISSGQGGFDDCMNTQGYIIKVEPDGDSIWMRRYDYYEANNGYLNHLYDLLLTSDDGMILTGETYGEPEWEQSLWVQKLDSIGCDTAGCDPTVGIAEWQGDKYSWRQGSLKLYPNPAQDRLNISMNNFNHVWFSNRFAEVYNMLGEKELETEIPGRTENYSLDVSSLTDGIYLLVVREGRVIKHSAKFLIAR